MVEEVMIEFDEVYNTDHIENVQPTLWEIRDLAVLRFDIPITIASLKQKSVLGKLEEGLLNLEQPMNLYAKVDLNRECVALEHHYKSDFVKLFGYCLVEKDLLFVSGFMQKGSLNSHLFSKYPAIQPVSCRKWVKIATRAAQGLAFHHNSEKQVTYRDMKSVNLLLDDNYRDLKASNKFLDDNYRDLKASNKFLDGNVKSTFKFKNHAIDAGDFTALNIPPASPRCRKTDVKIEKTVQWTGAPGAKNINEKASRQNQSYLYKTCPMKVRNESQCNIYHVLLLISTLLATITFHAALKFYLPGCRFHEGYESSSSVNSVHQIENQSSYSNRIPITFNSVVFFLSTALMMILFNELPFRPWLLVLVFSMVGSYMCTFMDPVNPSSLSS
ncbi:hypothetical protein LWI28_006816 [Acer negundo]|uniref:Protein kinase domain-containing protein n=1 Tax=Acer negundo TaxID=4023 RepID=A0AAD5NH83_ACENE|nr:hypothetical protein LWI28_006816 [Acer negundo]